MPDIEKMRMALRACQLHLMVRPENRLPENDAVVMEMIKEALAGPQRCDYVREADATHTALRCCLLLGHADEHRVLIEDVIASAIQPDSKMFDCAGVGEDGLCGVHAPGTPGCVNTARKA